MNRAAGVQRHHGLSSGQILRVIIGHIAWYGVFMEAVAPGFLPVHYSAPW